jgi:hypothetical protein
MKARFQIACLTLEEHPAAPRKSILLKTACGPNFWYTATEAAGYVNDEDIFRDIS